MIYKYKGKEYSSWYSLINENKETLGQISFPYEGLLTDELLAEYGITRHEYVPTLAEVKTAKIEELKTERDNAEESPVHTELGDFDFDTKARDRINGAKDVLNGTTETLEWTLANNEVVEVGYNDLKAVTDTAAVRCNALHLKYRDLRDLVNACTTVEQVNAISWDIINEE